jgi:hypothetical protein
MATEKRLIDENIQIIKEYFNKRLIDANVLKKEIVDFKINLHPQNQDYGTGYFSALSVVEGMLAYSPTVDAVEVVRCKDCGRGDQYANRPPYIYCMVNHRLVGEDDFCSNGERKDND